MTLQHTNEFNDVVDLRDHHTPLDGTDSFKSKARQRARDSRRGDHDATIVLRLWR